MIWNKLGIIWNPKNLKIENSISHAFIPTPFVLSEEIVRIYYTSLDSNNKGRTFFVDLNYKDNFKILNYSKKSILDLGGKGTFDEDGILATSVLEVNKKVYLFYVGFENVLNVRYKLFTGLAISEDMGETFKKYSTTPILDRTPGEQCFRCGPFVMHENNKFKMWYVGGSDWITDNTKVSKPVYDLKYIESENISEWPKKSKTVMKIDGKYEHGFGRPFILRHNKIYKLFYSIRNLGNFQYKLGYAESKNGINWERKDNIVGLNTSNSSFENRAVMYSSIINLNNNYYCFYNGNNFGENGIALAKLVEW